MTLNSDSHKPFFSIGITTYNRHELLKETLQSVLSQSFSDFEIIVGNDYQAEHLTGEMLGIYDPRVRFENYPKNLQEIGNMNALLSMATGRYFTWLFDDDLHEPDYLKTAYNFLSQNAFPPAIFTSFRQLRGSNPYEPQHVTPSGYYLLTGREFLRKYFFGNLTTISTSGFFDTVALRNTVGGMNELCRSAIGLYGEYLFLVQCALFSRIAYIDAPFVVMRLHENSWSNNNLEINKFLEAGQALVRRCGEVFHHPTLSDDLIPNLLGICKLHLYSYAYKSIQVEVATRQCGISALWHAIFRLAEEVAITKRTFIAVANTNTWSTSFAFLRVQFRHSCLILAWLIVLRIRRFYPDFMKLTRSYTPK